MKYKRIQIILLLFGLLAVFPLNADSQSDNPVELVEAVLCEDIKDSVPQNVTSIFSIERRTAICFTDFDPVLQKTIIYHHWYHRDVPSARIKLTLKPPRWASYSSIQLRAEDICPWRVEITDEQGNIFY